MKKKRQYRSNQGRSPEKMTREYKIIAGAFICLFISIIIMLIIR
tara:strand:- start:485 stop:616 length:132 start_codon:yes stop_codon:yes gene_type:complete